MRMYILYCTYIPAKIWIGLIQKLVSVINDWINFRLVTTQLLADESSCFNDRNCSTKMLKRNRAFTRIQKKSGKEIESTETIFDELRTLGLDFQIVLLLKYLSGQILSPF